MRSPRTGSVAAAVLLLLTLTGCGADADNARSPRATTATAPAPPVAIAVDREPNNDAVHAVGPVGPRGILLRVDPENGPNGNLDYVYFKVRPSAEITVAIRLVRGRCDGSFFTTYLPGGPGEGNGGQDQTAVRPEAPVIDANGNQDASIGDDVGATAVLRTHAEAGAGYRGGVIVGVLKYDTDSDGTAHGCTVRVTPSPAGALLGPDATDRDALRDPDAEY